MINLTKKKLIHPNQINRFLRNQDKSITKNIKFISTETHPEHPIPKNVQNQLNAWSKSILIPYARPPIILSHGKGCKVWDTEGRAYLDFTAGIAVNALGHADEQVAQVLYEQSKKLVHCSNLYHNDQAGELALALVRFTKQFGGLGFSPSPASIPSTTDHQTENPKTLEEEGCKVFFANSGAEANEGALKFARKCGKIADPSGKKHELVCFTNGFHGRTFGALSVTNQPKYQLPFAPLIPGVKSGQLNDISALDELITQNTCGVIVEPIQGEGGILEASLEFLRALRLRCDQVNAVLIFDEIQCGLGRSGNLWTHGSLPTDCHPDILTMAKPLANGIPIGAVMMKDRIANQIAIGDHGTTFGGAPLPTAVARHVLERICSKSFLEQVKTSGKLLETGLAGLVEKYPNLTQGPIRGKGLILGLEVKKNNIDNQGTLIGKIIESSRLRGLLLLSCGESIIRFVPSLIISHDEIADMIKILDDVLEQFNPKV